MSATNPIQQAAEQPAAAASPTKKRTRKPRQRKLPIAQVPTLVPYDLRTEKPVAPIFRHKLLFFLKLDKNQFKPESPLMQSQLCAADFIALRLVHAALNAEPWAVRELLDRVDNKPWAKVETVSEERSSMTIGIAYEAPVDQQQRYRREAMAQILSALPAELRKHAEKLLPEKKESRFIEVRQTEPQIEYLPPAEGVAE